MKRVGPSKRELAMLPAEAPVQDAIVDLLLRMGYTVLQLGRWRERTRCPQCGHYHTPHTGYGNTPGTPDLMVFSDRIGGWVGLECKAPGGESLLGRVAPGRVKPEQAALARAGMTTIVHSIEEACAALGIRLGVQGGDHEARTSPLRPPKR